MVISMIFAGTGFGLLLGILVGLSDSPVVGIVVGSLAALIAGYLGVKDKKAPEQGRVSILNALRGGFFSFACIIGVLSGVYIRTHNYLSPPEQDLKQQKAKWTAIGFSDDEAKLIVVCRELGLGQIQLQAATGILQSGSPSGKAKPTILKPHEKGSNDPARSVLFNAINDNSNLCDRIAIDNFVSLAAARDYYKNNNYLPLTKLTEVIMQNVKNEAVQKNIMRTTMEVLCAQQ